MITSYNKTSNLSTAFSPRKKWFDIELDTPYLAPFILFVVWSVTTAALNFTHVYFGYAASFLPSFGSPSWLLGVPFFVYAVILPSLAIGLAICVGVLLNPMHALLSLVGAFLASAAFYLKSGILFVGIVFVIVWVGAVAILILFVIMLLNVKSLTSSLKLIKHVTQKVGIVAGVLLASWLHQQLVGAIDIHAVSNVAVKIVECVSIYFVSPVYQQVTYMGPDVNAIAALYTQHASLFWVTTLNLLIALLGAIILATSTTERPVALGYRHARGASISDGWTPVNGLLLRNKINVESRGAVQQSSLGTLKEFTSDTEMVQITKSHNMTLKLSPLKKFANSLKITKLIDLYNSPSPCTVAAYPAEKKRPHTAFFVPLHPLLALTVLFTLFCSFHGWELSSVLPISFVAMKQDLWRCSRRLRVVSVRKPQLLPDTEMPSWRPRYWVKVTGRYRKHVGNVSWITSKIRVYRARPCGLSGGRFQSLDPWTCS
jgi:NADH:ubiquinone oxidoreductase subunit 6 (subunit J)